MTQAPDPNADDVTPPEGVAAFDDKTPVAGPDSEPPVVSDLTPLPDVEAADDDGALIVALTAPPKEPPPKAAGRAVDVELDDDDDDDADGDNDDEGLDPDGARSPGQRSVSRAERAVSLGQALFGADGAPMPQAQIDAARATKDLDQFIDARAAFQTCRQDVAEGRFRSALERLTLLLQKSPDSSELRALAAFAQLEMVGDDTARTELTGRLRVLQDQNPYCIVTMEYAGRANFKLGRIRAAARLFKKALEIEPGREDLALELRRCDDANRRAQRASSEVPAKTAVKTDDLRRIQNLGVRTASVQGTNAAGVLFCSAVFAVTFFGLYWPGLLMRIGQSEAEGDPRSPFLFIRVGVLLLGGLVFAQALARDAPFGILAKPRWVSAGILVGLAAAVLSPMKPVGDGSAPGRLAFALTIGVALAEVCYFRGFFDRALSAAGTPPLSAAILSGAAFGLYQLTFFAFWHQQTLAYTVLCAGSAAILLGVPLAFVHRQSGGILPPLLGHLSFSVALLARPIFFPD